jgi:hypothetical protein
MTVMSCRSCRQLLRIPQCEA